MAGQRQRVSGELEGAVLAILWAEGGPLTAKEILARFDEPVPAHTTVLTALERLRAKGDVVRTGPARGVQFAAARSEAEHAAESLLSVLDDTSDRSAVLLRFAGELDAGDLDTLRTALSRRER